MATFRLKLLCVCEKGEVRDLAEDDEDEDEDDGGDDGLDELP